MTAIPEWLSLEPDEEIVWTGHPRVRRIISSVATFGLWSIAAFVAAFALTTTLNLPLPVPDPIVWGLAVLWALLQAVAPTKAYLRTKNTDYVLTNQNIYKKTGVWSENVTRVGVDKIQNTQLKKDFFGNTFDYGTVLISTAGGGGVELSVEDLDEPDEFRSQLRTMMARASDRKRSEPRSSLGGVAPESLQSLVDEARRMRETAESIERHLH
ncbi:MAG: PH domain-containing protein [Halobacteriota archaeon]